MFTADQARAIQHDTRFQEELAANQSRLQGVASIENATELARQRKIGVLIYDGGDDARMADEMRRRGFVVSVNHTGLRAHW